MTETVKETMKFKYPSLNGLRALSIIFVIISHLEFQHHLIQDSSFSQPIKLFLLFFTDGHLGVNIFFVISGFLITTLLLTEEQKDQKVSLKNFYIRRVLRIFPAYYFYLFILFIIQLKGFIHISMPSWLAAVTYTKYFNNLDWYTGHAWSLSIEELFYLITPLLFTFGDKVRKRGAILIVLVIPIIKIFYHCMSIKNLPVIVDLEHMDALATGCLVAFYKDALLSILEKHFKLLFYTSFLVVFLFGYLSLISKLLNIQLDYIIVPFGSFCSLGNASNTRCGTLTNVCVSIILLYSIYGHKGFWFKLVNSKVLNYVGLLSYSIYLWQQLFISGKSLSWASSFPLNLVFTAMFALFSYYCIEAPFLKLKDKFQKA
jgi:peptidoglycan/LPS O-acetylase OafA/YrhL